MTVGDIVKSTTAINKLLMSDKLPIKTAYKIARNAKVLEGELSVFEGCRGELLEKYKSVADNEKVLKEEMEKLLNEEVKIQLYRVGIEELEGANLTPVDLIALEYLIEGSECDNMAEEEVKGKGKN